MDALIQGFYIDGGMWKMMLCEFIRGFSWGCGFFTIAVPVVILVIILGIWLVIKFLNREYKK